MKLQTISRDKICRPRRLTTRGFTLIEISIVISLVAIIGSISLYFNFDSFRRDMFHSDREILVSALQHARAEAMANICRGISCTDGKPHGVSIQDNAFIIFQGSSFTARDSEFDAEIVGDPATAHRGVREIVFAPLSGDASSSVSSLDCTASTPLCIQLETEGTQTSIISINTEGQITWTN